MVQRLVLIAVVLILSAPSLAQSEELHQQSSRDWVAAGVARVEIENPKGDVSVRPSQDGQVHLVALKLIRNSEQRGADQLARDTRLVADLESGVLKINVRYPARREIKLNVWDLVKHLEWPEVDMQLVIEVPAGMHLSLRSTSGDLQTSALTGPQQLRSLSGDIDVARASGSLSIETRSGDVTVNDVAGSSIATTTGNVIVGSSGGTLVVETRSGDIRIDSAADSVSATTRTGEVRVGLARLGLTVRTDSGDIIARAGGMVRVETSTGETKMALTAPLRSAEFRAGSGDVTLRVAQAIECRIDAETQGGNVEVALPLLARTSSENQVLGRIGRGTTAIVIRTSTGSIIVAR